MNAPDFIEKLGRISRALEASVNGRGDDAFVYADSIALESACSGDFLYNVIESRTLDRRFNRQGVQWSPNSDCTIARC
jgi:hypothetical protein